ncbi:MAG: helix-turn-helix domain-containing protein [Oscillospiraceae bacterium]|jgi:transcriptional regulator with XRE-family HTH domain|nr:helix-turn-helix domain-containing protein [Oscillospiraceae bacterium]
MKFERIRNLREDHDYKQIQLANYLCIKQSTYSDYENGKINIPIEAFMKLADFYRTSVDFLVARTDEHTPYQKSGRR